MKISVGLLAYNSERWIPESAGCLQPYVDEVFVLVDSATTDNTERILDEMKINHARHVWDHSYGAAKNRLIDYLTGDWIIILDDDEKYTNEAAKKLIYIIKSVSDNIDGMEIPMKLHYPYWTTDESDWLKEIGYNQHLSIFRNKYRYEGILHEGIPVPYEKRLAPEYFIERGIFIHNHAWKGNREKYEKPHAQYYEDLTNGKIPDKGVHYW